MNRQSDTSTQARALWQAGDSAGPSEAVNRFLAGDDIRLDQQLLPFDIEGTRAHVRGLARIGILDDAELVQLTRGLDTLKAYVEAGSFVLDHRFEDGHSAIEWYLAEQCGEVGLKVHTGRSRNDQVLTATRLYIISRLDSASDLVHGLAGQLLERAESSMQVPMPGYTHLQRAMPITLGMWYAGFAESMIDNLTSLSQAMMLLNASPLGTAAGFGVPLDLDREGVADELGFDRVQINPMYAQNSRGKLELVALNALHQCMLDVRRISWDLSLFSTSEFGFVRFDSGYSTGSSIMPNKVNPDVVELMRASCSQVEACIHQLQSLQALPSGYQRDLQMTKGAMMRGIETSLQVLSLLPGLIESAHFDSAAMAGAISDDMMATDRALEAVKSGLSFREAYRQQKPASDGGVSAGCISLEESISRRISLGGCANPGLDVLRARLDRSNLTER